MAQSHWVRTSTMTARNLIIKNYRLGERARIRQPTSGKAGPAMRRLSRRPPATRRLNLPGVLERRGTCAWVWGSPREIELTKMKPLRIKRVYDVPSPDDGVRVLVDRLWPRGLKREGSKIDLWLKEVAPSDGLRRWFAHDPSRWAQFEKRYHAELAKNAEHVAVLRELIKGRNPLTLLYAAKDTEHNNAAVLREFLLP
jgi:uncharacterized protein YeaO (DUF488 family)